MKKVKMIKLLLIVAAALTSTISKAAAEETIQPSKQILGNRTIEVGRIAQKFNHFNYSDNRTIEMIYGLKTEFYKRGGPLFVYVGDNFPFESKRGPETDIIDRLVEEHNGAYLMYCHYNIESAADIKDAQYLTVEQSLADLSYLIRTIKKMYAGMQNAKVILSGAFTGGSLATWFKILYPDLVNGVWASSAPLLAKADFSEYYEVLGQSIKEQGGAACYNRIKNGLAELESMLADNLTARVALILNLCDSFDGNNDLDVSVLFYKIFQAFDSPIQRHQSTIQMLCGYVRVQQSDISAIIYRFARTWRGTPCVESSYCSYLEQKRNAYEIHRLYQQCNQLGWFQTSSSPNQPFGSKCPLSFFTTVCKDLFGNNFARNDLENNVREFNDNYGAIDLKLENVYWTYGELDAWRALGIRDGRKATFIPLCAQGCDIWLADAASKTNGSNEKLAALVRTWLR